jgi:hypothetical protein
VLGTIPQLIVDGCVKRPRHRRSAERGISSRVTKLQCGFARWRVRQLASETCIQISDNRFAEGHRAIGFCRTASRIRSARAIASGCLWTCYGEDASMSLARAHRPTRQPCGKTGHDGRQPIEIQTGRVVYNVSPPVPRSRGVHALDSETAVRLVRSGRCARPIDRLFANHHSHTGRSCLWHGVRRQISPGFPIDGSGKFQPVVVASGTATSGSRIPPRSFPSRSTCGTRCGRGVTFSPIVRAGPWILRGSDTPGSGGNTLC